MLFDSKYFSVTKLSITFLYGLSNWVEETCPGPSVRVAPRVVAVRSMSGCAHGSGGQEITHRKNKHISKYITYNGIQVAEGC